MYVCMHARYVDRNTRLKSLPFHLPIHLAPRPLEVPEGLGLPAVRPAAEVHAVAAEDHDRPGGEVQLRPHSKGLQVHVVTAHWGMGWDGMQWE